MSCLHCKCDGSQVVSKSCDWDEVGNQVQRDQNISQSPQNLSLNLDMTVADVTAMIHLVLTNSNPPSQPIHSPTIIKNHRSLLSTKNCGRLINKIFKQTRFT